MIGPDWFDLPVLRGYFVYALYGADNELLYIGQSTQVLSRIGSHISNPRRGDDVARVAVLSCASKADMDETELRLIQTYCPPWNRAGLPDDVYLERRAAEFEQRAAEQAAWNAVRVAEEARLAEAARQRAEREFNSMTMTIEQAAKYTGRGKTAIKRAARSGELKSTRAPDDGSYRFRGADLDEWMFAGCTARAVS